MTDRNRTPADAPERSADGTSALGGLASAARRVVSGLVSAGSGAGTRSADAEAKSETETKPDAEARPGAGASDDAADGRDEETPPREQSLADVGPETDVPVTFHTKYPTLSATVPPVRVDPPTTMRYRDDPNRAKRREPVTGDEARAVPDAHYVLRAWCDVLVTVDEAGELEVETAGETFHGAAIPAASFGDLGRSIRYGDYCDEVVVLPCPWKVETPERVGTATVHAPGHHAEPFRVATTATNTAYVHDIPVVLAIEDPDEEREILISKGDPLVSVWPFVRSRPSASVAVDDEAFWHEYENSYPNISVNLDDFETYVEKDPLLDTATHRDVLTHDPTTDE